MRKPRRTWYTHPINKKKWTSNPSQESCDTWIEMLVCNNLLDLAELLIKTLQCLLTLSWQRPLLYRNQSIDLLCKSMDWFLYDNALRHERVNLLSPGTTWQIFIIIILWKKIVTEKKNELKQNWATFQMLDESCSISDISRIQQTGEEKLLL